MKIRWLKGDWEFGKFKLQFKKDGCADVWEDVQMEIQPEKKPRKLWEIIRCAHPVPDEGGHNQIYQHMASVSIDSVIECYEEFDNRDCYDRRTFPEYLKEKML